MSGGDTSVLTCVIDMRFTAAAVERAVQLLLSTVSRTESKSGCVSCSVGLDATEPTRVRYHEAWSTESAFRRHVRSEEFRRVLVAMDLCREEPEVTVGTIAGPRGIDFLLELHDDRGGTAGPTERNDSCHEES